MSLSTVISVEEAARLRALVDRFEEWRGDRRSWKVEDVPPDLHQPTHAELSALEVFAFRHSTATGWYFAYMCETGPDKHAKITTWPGDTLARVSWIGAPFKSPGFGRPSVRRHFRAVGIDGRTWSGTYYESAGSYVRMRPCKARG